jgi:hypothetical protein
VLRGGVIAGVALAILTFVVGVIGIASAFLRTRSSSIDPSEKARLLAQAISEVMNFVALAIVGSLVGTAVAVTCGFVRARRRRRSKPD